MDFLTRLSQSLSDAHNVQKDSFTFYDPPLLLPDIVKAKPSGFLRFIQEPRVGHASFDPSSH